MRCFACARSVKIKANFCGRCGAFLSESDVNHPNDLQSLVKIIAVAGTTVVLGVLFLLCFLIVGLAALKVSGEFIALMVLTFLFAAAMLSAAVAYELNYVLKSFQPRERNQPQEETTQTLDAPREPLYSVTEPRTLIMPNPALKIKTFQ